MKLIDGTLTPLYQQVMADIKDDIDCGSYNQGDKIPSESELSEMYSVSRITVRRAVEELAGEGYLIKKQGKGTFVNRPKLVRKICQHSEIQSFTQTCAEAGRVAGARLLGRELTRARSREREFLRLPEGADLIHVKRLRTADGVPIMLENNFFPRQGFEFLLGEDLSDCSIFDVVERNTGRHPDGDELCTLEIVRAGLDASNALDVTVGEPLFLENIHFVDGNRKPLLIGRQYIVGSLYVFDI